MLRSIITRHWLLTFILMCASACLFVMASVNLFVLLKANLQLIFAHGTLALADGALVQLLELLATGLVAAISYLIFRSCERVLVEKILS